jgi:TM2 domain-containing membrane protein YozV
MTTCERCGNDIADNLALCPHCGTVTSKAKESQSPTTSYGVYSDRYYNQPPMYARDNQPTYISPHSQEYHVQQQIDCYGQSYQSPPMYQQAPFHSTVSNTSNSTPLIVELLLSIFLGIFGIGWLMAGEVVTGIILLVCSLFIYLPLLIISIFIAFFTFGFSLFCTGPMVIGAIILNAILLNNKLKRKASTYMPIPPN